MGIQTAKRCSRCGTEKELDQFYKDGRASDGLASCCKRCHREYTKAYAETHREIARQCTARYRQRNPGCGKETFKKWCANNRDKMNAKQLRYARSHPDKIRELVAISSAKRKAAKLNAMPQWIDQKAVAIVYRKTRQLSAKLGVVLHVDHIVPLIHPLVCGLHIPANLQVLAASENTSKANRFWPDMP